MTTTPVNTARTVTSTFPGAYTINYDRRLDGPAAINVYPHDDRNALITVWNQRGQRYHRVDGPALTTSDGNIYWEVDGVDVASISEHIG